MPAALLLSLIAASQATAPALHEVERATAAMGTSLRLSVRAASRAQALSASEAALRALIAVEDRLTTWRDDSELSRLNAQPAGEAFELSPQLRRELADCADWQLATGGAFDPTVGGLVALWDLRGAGRIPSDAEIERALEARGLPRVLRLEGSSAARLHPQLRLEEGGFGKGSGLDAALEELARAGATGTLDLGGQFATLGRALELPLADPRDRGRPVLAWHFETGSVATSGNGERGREVDGVRIGHILDPRSGRPAPDFGSMSAWCDRAARADAFSTAAYVMGPERALAWAGARNDVELVALCVEGEGLVARVTPALAGRLRALVPDVRIEVHVQTEEPRR